MIHIRNILYSKKFWETEHMKEWEEQHKKNLKFKTVIRYNAISRKDLHGKTCQCKKCIMKWVDVRRSRTGDPYYSD